MLTSGEILVIEDNTVDGMFVAKTLRDSHTSIPVRVLDSCEKGIDYLFGTGQFENHGAPLPCLIILDLKHRGMSGFDFLTIIRAHHQFREIPIVVFSDSRSEHERSMALNNGANAFFAKSIDLNSFLQSIRTIASEWLPQGVPS